MGEGIQGGQTWAQLQEELPNSWSHPAEEEWATLGGSELPITAGV